MAATKRRVRAEPLSEVARRYAEFATWLRGAIEDRGWSMTEAAGRFDVSGTSLRGWLAGGTAVRSENIINIAAALGIDRRKIDALMGAPMTNGDDDLWRTIQDRPLLLEINRSIQGLEDTALEIVAWQMRGLAEGLSGNGNSKQT